MAKINLGDKMDKLEVVEQQHLKWPDGWERTPIAMRKPQNGWKKNLRGYREDLLKELKRIGVTECLLSWNFDATQARMDPGVAVYFSKAKKQDYSWQVALGIDAPAPTLAQIDEAYRSKAMVHHPDRGGDVEIFKSLTKHRDNARAYVKGTERAEHEFVIPCDRFDEVHLNLNAIRLAMAAFRQLDRVGVPAILERTFRGFKTALPTSGVRDEQPVNA